MELTREVVWEAYVRDSSGDHAVEEFKAEAAARRFAKRKANVRLRRYILLRRGDRLMGTVEEDEPGWGREFALADPVAYAVEKKRAHEALARNKRAALKLLAPLERKYQADLKKLEHRYAKARARILRRMYSLDEKHWKVLR